MLTALWTIFSKYTLSCTGESNFFFILLCMRCKSFVITHSTWLPCQHECSRVQHWKGQHLNADNCRFSSPPSHSRNYTVALWPAKQNNLRYLCVKNLGRGLHMEMITLELESSNHPKGESLTTGRNSSSVQVDLCLILIFDCLFMYLSLECFIFGEMFVFLFFF